MTQTKQIGKILSFKVKTDINGNTMVLDIDTANNEYAYGYFRFPDPDDILLTKKEFNKLLNQLIWLNFTLVNSCKGLLGSNN